MITIEISSLFYILLKAKSMKTSSGIMELSYLVSNECDHRDKLVDMRNRFRQILFDIRWKYTGNFCRHETEDIKIKRECSK